MAYTKTSIISLIVMLVGHKPIQTLDNADDLVTAAEQVTDMMLPAILATGNWRFAAKIEQLTLTSLLPPPQTCWQNIYLLPAGYLKNIRIIPNNYVYEIYANEQIWCNWGTLTPVFMEFIFQPDYSQLPSYFVNYFIYEVAFFLALNNAQKPDYADRLDKTRILNMGMANAVDAQNRPQFNQWDIPVLNRRNITGIIGNAIG